MKSKDDSRTFRGTFTNRHVVLPVIHVESESQALSNAELALRVGADGVFLINHSISSGSLLKIHCATADRFPDAWIGVNCLDLTPEEVFTRISERVDGVWADNAMIDESSEQQPSARSVLNARQEAGCHALYFGGVAFKYQRHVDDLTSAARKAADFVDVVTTSGPGTGLAAHVDKIRWMKEALGTLPLAIASGLTPDNIEGYLPYSDCYLVATGISTSFSELNSSLLESFVARVRSYETPHAGLQTAGELESAQYQSVCFVCEWNEGRSAHLDLSVSHKLRAAGCAINMCSAGLSQGGGINAFRRDYLLQLGIPLAEIESHDSMVFSARHAQCDLVLVAETQMKDRLLARWPLLMGRIMTIRAFALGQSPENETLSSDEAHLEDAGGHDNETKLKLYAEVEELAQTIASRLCERRAPGEVTSRNASTSKGVEQFVRLSSMEWPDDKELEVKPGDLTQFAPMGNGVGAPLVMMPWHDPSSIGSVVGYYSFHPRTGHPISDAPLTEAAGGTIFFGQECCAEDLDALLRLLQVGTHNKAYAAFIKHADDPAQERYLTQLRIVSKFGLRYMYGAISDEEMERFPEQDLTVGELIWRFIEFNRNELSGRTENGLAGVMGGDGDFAYERLAFGFMVENAYHAVYRVWTRAWLVTK